jgi:hypothetical protein
MLSISPKGARFKAQPTEKRGVYLINQAHNQRYRGILR